MGPKELEQFVSDGRVSYTITMPSVGHRSRTKPAIRLFAAGNKVAVFTGDEEYDPAVSVYSSAQKVGDSVILQTVRPFPAPQIILSKVKPGRPSYKAFDDAFEDLDDRIGGNWESLREQANQRMNETQVWVEPPRAVTVHYMNWFEYSEDENFSGPKGIVAISPSDGRVIGIPFPGREAEAAEFAHWKGLPPDLYNATRADYALRSLAAEAGSRNLFFSDPREMNGHSWEDATQRALHDYAAEIYTKTQRSPF